MIVFTMKLNDAGFRLYPWVLSQALQATWVQLQRDWYDLSLKIF